MKYWLAAGLLSACLATPVWAQTPAAPSTANYAADQGFPDRNGPFSAMMVIIPEQQLAEFAKPAGSNRSLSRVARAEPGAKLAVKILFTGPAADLNKIGKVTADIMVFAPNGQIYANSDFKELPVWTGQVGDGRGMFDNRDRVPVITFEPGDAPGVYTIRAVVHDRFAMRDIPLQQTVELLAPPPVTAPAQAAPAETPKAAPAPAAKKKSRRKRR